MAELDPIISPEVLERIIKNYKASEDFFHEVVEGSIDGFSKGFKLCQSMVQNFFPDFDVSRLKEFSDDDDDEAEAEAEAKAKAEVKVKVGARDEAKVETKTEVEAMVGENEEVGGATKAGEIGKVERGSTEAEVGEIEEVTPIKDG